jgi:hypothetical protein
MTGVAGLHLSLGVQNDGQFLYFVIITQDPQQAALLTEKGFTLWFDGAGGRAKSAALEVPAALTDDNTRPPSPKAGFVPHYVTVRSVGQPERLVPAKGSADVDIAAGFDNGIYCYEIRLSLSCVGATPGRQLAVGLRAFMPLSSEHHGESGEHAGHGAHMHGMGSRHTMGGPGGGPRGESGQGGATPDQAKPTPPMGVESWLQIALAPAPAAAQ